MRRLIACALLVLLSLQSFATDVSVPGIREIRLQGDLSTALAHAKAGLSLTEGRNLLELHLELARIHDRIGLHNNTRPVAAALLHIEQAAALAPELDDRAQADVDLAFAEYFYRAEMSERKFSSATQHAEKALAAFEILKNFHGQADAVHRLGLIHLQQRKLDAAYELFEESLRLDRIAGERPLLRADYERHVGFVYALREDYETALPYFERSLQFRLGAGFFDPAMFAAISVGSALIELDRGDEARPYLEYALQLAENLDSEAGRTRAETNLTQISE